MMRYLCFLLCSVFLLQSTAAEAGRKQVRKVSPTAISAKSFLIAEHDGTVIKEQDSLSVRPIASISKLMVGLLASEQDLAEQLPIPPTRQVQSSIPNKTVSLSRKELLILALVKSDNFAAQILCSNIPACVERMNIKAQEIGMLNTKFTEPTGLDRNNVSTAQDLLKLMIVSSGNSVVSELSSLPTADISAGKSHFQIRNTNPLTSKFNISLSKTGFTNPAGGCLVMIANAKIFILLGSRDARSRIPDMEKLVRQY